MRFPILVAVSAAALPLAAQAQTPPPSTPQMDALRQAGMAFVQCIQTGASSVPATATPEAGAASVMSGCATQRTAVETAGQAYIATLPEADRPAMQERLRSQLSGAEAQLAAGIRQRREAAAATPAPAQ